MKRAAFGSIVVLALWAAAAPAQEKPFQIIVTAGKHEYKNTPLCVPVSLSATAARQPAARLTGGGVDCMGEFTAPGLLTESIRPSEKGLIRRDLYFVLPHLKAGQSLTLTVKPQAVPLYPDPTYFTWKGVLGEYAELTQVILGGARRRPVLRYMYEAYDNSTPEQRDRTYKVFHHLYDPEGKRLVTNGGQADLQPGEKKKFLFPHHRGLMFAYMRCTYGEGKGTTADTWHARPGDTHQAHTAFAKVEAGELLGRHRVLVNWQGPKNEIFAKEERELTVCNLPGGTLVEFASRLKTTGGKVKLDGDPQHAGFQFRAHNNVAMKTAKQTYYVRPDGKGKPGETRNWEPKTKKGPINLPWDAMSFVLDGKRYTVAYLNHPSNPGESRWSERDYGRFGCYVPYDLTPERPLVLRYRLWLQDGEMAVPDVAALHTNFVEPPRVTMK